MALLAACAPDAVPTPAVPSPGHTFVTDLSVVGNHARLAPDAPRCGHEVAQDGSVGPVTCDGGRVNADVFADMMSLSPRLFALPRTHNWRSVEQALCSDYFSGGTIPITSDAYQYRYVADRWSDFADFPSPEKFSVNLMNQVYCD